MSNIESSPELCSPFSREMGILARLCDETGIPFEAKEMYQSALASLHQKQEELLRQVIRDPLTGLYNRSGFTLMVNNLLSVRTKSDEPWPALFAIDLDGFKLVNDMIGHHAGDEALIVIAKRLVHIARGGDIAARSGGDEFWKYASHVGTPENAVKIGLRLIHSIVQPIPVTVHDEQGEMADEVHLGASVGAVVFEPHAVGISAAKYLADKLMYRVKDNGKNGICAAQLDVESNDTRFLGSVVAAKYTTPAS